MFHISLVTEKDRVGKSYFSLDQAAAGVTAITAPAARLRQSGPTDKEDEMSQNLSKEAVLFRQRLLSCCGFYTDDLDGLWGPHTEAADQAFFARSSAIAAAEGSFDPRTERNLLTLQCDAQAAARRSLASILAALPAGSLARIISGTRTYAEQDALFRQGRFGNPPPKVTNARGGQSWHNFGLAWDIGIFRGGVYVTADGPYRTVAPSGKVTDVSWGGDFPGSFKDPPHYQFKTAGQTITQAQARFEAGCR
jgi:peptidoglycan LD-endopeptidase CwlK